MNLDITQIMNFCEEIFDLNKTQIFNSFFTNFQICRHFGPPFALVSSRFARSYDVSLGTCDFILALISLENKSRSSYLLVEKAGKMPERYRLII